MVNLPPEWGADPVPPQKRVLKSFDIFFLWFSLAVGLLVLQAGGSIKDLSTAEVFAVAILGSVVGSVMLGLAGSLGSKYGVPTMVSLRAVLGLRGSYLPTILNVVQLVGWSSFEILIMASSALLIAGSFFGSFTLYFWIAVFASFCMLMGIGGPVVVIRQWLEKFAIWLTAGTAIFITYVIVYRFPSLLAMQGNGTLPFMVALDIVIAMPISWWPLISDYNRFAKTEKGAFAGTIAGYTLANSWFYALGALLSLAFLNQTPLSAIVSLSFGGLALLILLVDETDNGFADIYSGAVSIQNLKPKTRQWKLILAITGISAVLASLTSHIWQDAYQGFLLFIGAVFVPLLGVLAVDFFVIRKRQYRLEEFYSSAKDFRVKPVIAWFVGIAAYFLFSYFTALGSSIPAFVVSAVTLYLFERVA